MPNVHVPWYPTTICGTHIYLPSHERTDQIVCGSEIPFSVCQCIILTVMLQEFPLSSFHTNSEEDPE